MEIREGDNLYKIIYSEMLTADYSQRYWGKMALRVQRFGYGLNILILLLSSGTLISFLAGKPLLIGFLSILTTGLSFFVLVWDPLSKSNEMARICEKWYDAMNRLKVLYLNYSTLEASYVTVNLDNIFQGFSDLKEKESRLPHRNEKIKEICDAEVRKAWGIN